MKATHDFNIQGLQRMAGWLDEVDAGMDSVVHNVHAIHLVLCLEIGIESLLNVFHNWSPGIIIVDKVTKARGINHGQTEADSILFNVCTDGLDGDCLGDDVQAGPLALAWRIKRGVEESIDQGRFS